MGLYSYIGEVEKENWTRQRHLVYLITVQVEFDRIKLSYSLWQYRKYSGK